MKRIVLFLGLLLLAIPARAQYLDGLPAVSAVAPTDIIPICQGGTTGHAGTCTTRKATASQLQVGGLFNTSLNLGSGTLTAANAILGGATFSGALHMGAFVIDGTNAQFTGGTLTGLTYAGGFLTGTFTGSPTFSGTPVFSTGASLTGTLSGSPTFSGAPTFSGTPVFSTGAAMSGTFSGAHTYSGALTLSAASTALTVTNNASLGGTLTTGTGVTNGFLMSGTIFSVTGSGNSSATIRGLGTGAVNLQTGATPFTGFSLADGGASVVNSIRVAPGTTGNGVTIQAVGDAAAVLKFAAGTSGTAGTGSFSMPIATKAISQNNNFVLAGNPAALSTEALSIITNISGTNGGSLASNLSQINLNVNDTAVINGSIGAITANYALNSGFDGSRFPINFSMTKTASSVTGDGVYLTASIFNHPTAGEAGTGDTITASQTAGVLTVTAATGSVIGKGVGSIQTWIYGAGMTPEKWVSNGTGTGGTGTYNVDKRQDISSQTMSVANFAGSYEAMNPDMNCETGLYTKGCQIAEFDVRLRGGDAQFKNGIIVNYGTFDAYHGISSDCAFCTTSAGTLNAGGVYIYAVGNGYAAWPIDSDRTDSVMLGAYPTPQAGVWSGNPARYRAGYVVNAEVVECLTACWRSPGLDVDGGGQISAGPITVTYSATGTLISAGRSFASASAAITAGGAGFTTNDRTEGPDRSIWSASTVVAGAATVLTMIEPGYSTVCPSAGSAFRMISPGTGLKATITCNTSNGIVLGAASDKLGFYAATAIVKATPVGACAGSTGCQALRDALGNLGLINTGSISD